MPKLFYAPGACSFAVHVVLEWIGKPYETIRVDQHSPSFRAINPAGAGPALATAGGIVLTQADALLHCLGRTYPDADLLDERTPEAAAEIDRWGCFLTGDLHPAFLPMATPGRYTTATAPEALAAVVTADAYVFPRLNWAQGKLPDGLSVFPATARLYQRLLADPAIGRVVLAEGLVRGPGRSHPDVLEQSR